MKFNILVYFVMKISFKSFSQTYKMKKRDIANNKSLLLYTKRKNINFKKWNWKKSSSITYQWYLLFIETLKNIALL